MPQEHPIRVNACPQPPLAGVARPPLPPGEADGGEAPPAWLLCAQRHTLDLWELGDAEAAAAPGAAAAPPAEGALLPPGDPPEHLLRLSLTAGRHVVAAAISADGRWLACSDASRLACFALEQRGASEEVPEAHVVPVPLPLPRDLPPAAHLAFRPATHQLLALASDGTLRIVDMEAAAQRQRAEAGVPNGLHHGEGGADGGGGAGGVVTVRALHDLQYKSSQRRERQRSAARRLWPLVELAAVSPDGAWLAAVVRQRVHLLSLASHKLGAALPPLAEPQPPLTALAFTADSAEVAVAAASHQVATYGVASGQPSAWTAAHGGSLPPKLLRMPGAIRSIASCPAAPSSLFLASSEACCHLDTAAPLEGEEGGGGGRKRRRQKPVLASEPPGANCRMIYCADPVLHAAYLAPRSLLVVSWGGGMHAGRLGRFLSEGGGGEAGWRWGQGKPGPPRLNCVEPGGGAVAPAVPAAPAAPCMDTSRQLAHLPAGAQQKAHPASMRNVRAVCVAPPAPNPLPFRWSDRGLRSTRRLRLPCTATATAPEQFMDAGGAACRRSACGACGQRTRSHSGGCNDER
jgi:U3 small nucleolar RNA-associated protein 4